jgi:hypothetical protein
MLGVATGVAGIAFGGLLIYEIGFVHGLFTAQPQWTPNEASLSPWLVAFSVTSA